MTSAIDPALPVTGTPTTASVRSNFQIAHDEITNLQAELAALIASQVAVSPAIGALGANVQTALSALNATINSMAPIASPVFTGDPHAPTPTAGDNDNSIATTAFVHAAVATAVPALPVSIANGGTAAITAPAALTSLGAVAKAGDTMTGVLTINPGSVVIEGPTCTFEFYDRTSGASQAWGWYADGNIARLNSLAAGADVVTVTSGGSLTIGGATSQYTFNSRTTGAANRFSWYADATNAYLNSFAGSINALTISSIGDLAAVRSITAGSGFGARAGTPGPSRANVFNIDWAPGAQLWVDNVNAGTFAFTCDYRIKENIADLPSTWDRVKGLRPISYTRADHAELLSVADPAERWGFLAHELQECLLPTAATGDKDAPNLVQSPDLLALIASLTRALQEAMARIETLEAGSAT